MRYLATITMLVLALAMAQPVAAQSFKPDPGAGIAAWKQKDYPGSATRSQQAVPSTATSASAALAPPPVNLAGLLGPIFLCGWKMIFWIGRNMNLTAYTAAAPWSQGRGGLRRGY
jgi:hypothetical protein